MRWLHDESGLTWDQLGRLFGVSRRAVHLWASGSRLDAAHAETLAELVSVVRGLPETDRDGRRAALLVLAAGGRSIVDEFRARHSSGPGDVSEVGPSPDELLGARHGDVAE